MASVHSFNETLAKVRGVPRATIEAYSRVLRRDGLLPETKRGGGATPMTTVQAGYMLAAVMRGSPTAAADNAREVGDLVLHSVAGISGAGFEPIVDRTRDALGWSDGITFAEAIGWLIDRHVDDTIDGFASDGKGIEVKVDRYWSMAWLRWQPCASLLDEYVGAFREALKIEPPRDADGSLQAPMEIGFHTPLLHEAKITYGVDSARNREAHRKYRELRERAGKVDVWGSESITQRTLIAIAEVFK